MSFGYSVGNFMAISGLALKVYTAYKDAPGDYKNISDEVESLLIIIIKAAQHFEGPALSDNCRQEGQTVLSGCQNVLEDLDALIEKYNSLGPMGTGQVLQRFKLSASLVLGTEDIATLRARLTSNTTLLTGFIQSCEFHKFDKMQPRLDSVLGRHSTMSGDSVVSFAGSINIKKAYKKFCKCLFNIGVTAEMIGQKDKEIQDIRPEIDSLVGPLMLSAAEAGNTKRLVSTLEFVRNINFADDLEETALHKAAAKGHTDIVQLLLSQGASIEARSFYTKQTPLNLAAWGGHTSTVELLLSKGASLEAKDLVWRTPLHLAAWGGHTSTVELFLSKGASLEAKDADGWTPLHFAASGGYTNTVEPVLSRGASLETKDANGWTPLHRAASGGHTSTVELLLSRGASLEAKDPDGWTLLHHAASAGHTSTAELLLSKGASTEAMNKAGKSPLDLAIYNGYQDTAEFLKSKVTKLI